MTRPTLQRRLEPNAAVRNKLPSGPAIITSFEQELLVDNVKQKSCAAQALRRSEIKRTVLAILTRREQMNSRDGKPIPLSLAAKSALDRS